jgi:thioredoxin-like negative regulator of GroEL
MSQIIEVTKENFQKEVLEKKGLSVVKFYLSQGCGNCEAMKPVFEEFAALHKGIKCFQINVDQNREFSQQYPFRTLPGIFFFEEGKPFFNTEGVANMEQLGLPFKPTNELKAIAYDLSRVISQAKEAEKLIPTINNLISKQEGK